MWEWWQKNRPLFLGGVLLLVALLWYSVSLRQQEGTNFIESVVLRLVGEWLCRFGGSHMYCCT